MIHDEVVPLLIEEPSAPLPPAASAHVAACEECRALARALEVLANEGEEAAPPPTYWVDFDERLEERLARPELPRRTEFPRTWLAAAAAALVAPATFALVREPAQRPSRASAEAGRLMAIVTHEDAESVLEAARALTDWPAAEDAEALEDLARAGDELATSHADEAGWTSDPLTDPLGRLADKLSTLDPEQSRALAQRLEEELKS